MDLLDCVVCQRNSDFLATVLGKSEHACRSLKCINDWDSSRTAAYWRAQVCYAGARYSLVTKIE